MSDIRREKSDNKCHPAWQRIQALRLKTSSTWADIAGMLGVGVSTLMMVKSGRRGMSDKLLYRLAQAEIAAGIEAPIDEHATMKQIDGLTHRTNQSITHFLPPDLLKGLIKDVILDLNETMKKIEALRSAEKSLRARLKNLQQTERLAILPSRDLGKKPQR